MTGPLPEHVRVAVIGAGLSGLGAGIRLRQAGRTDFVILERAAAVGGTWRDNTYPGCTCDIPSHLYSFSFAPNPGWSHSFSRQPEIRSYLTHLSQRHHLAGHLHFGTEVRQAPPGTRTRSSSPPGSTSPTCRWPAGSTGAPG